MKKIFSFLVLLAGMAALTSCGDDDATYQAIEPLPIVKADVLFGAKGGDGIIETQATTAISATTDAQWLTLTTEGSNIVVTAAHNPSLEARSAKITVTATDGTTSDVTATQYGLLLNYTPGSKFVFNASANDPAIVADKSNVMCDLTISDDWIHVEKTSEGYVFTVDNNETGAYRRGSVHLQYFDMVDNTVYVGQWPAGNNDVSPEDFNTATWTDENGIEQSKAITLEAGGTEAVPTIVIKGLIEEGDIVLTKNTRVEGEYFISAGYSPGKRTVDGTTYTLRCIMKSKNKTTGNDYYPTTVSTSNASAYRMAIMWTTDDECNAYFGYTRNGTLGPAYETDGFVIFLFKTASGAAASNRVDAAYTFLNFRLSKQ